MSADEIEDALDRTEELIGWQEGMRDENRKLRGVIHCAIDAFEAGFPDNAEFLLRMAVARAGRAQHSGGAK